jgi:glycosyltransferase involved in cell wall biosynthesis
MGIMRIAMVTPWKVRCGIYTYTKNLVEALVKYNTEIYVVRLPRFGRLTSELLKNVAESVPLSQIDLVHVQHEYGLYQGLEGRFYPVLKSRGKPIITTMHSVGAWEIDRVIAEVSDRIIVHNEFCFKRLDFPKRAGIIPHGALTTDTPPPPSEECKKSLRIDPRTPIVGYMGFISPYKGLETLIEAMIPIKNAALLIGGGWHVERDTEYIANLREWSVKTLPKRCRWLGYVSDVDLSRVYGAMDLVVYPSRFATESGALIMALGHRKAVIASNVAPFKEKEKVGALITFKSVKDLTRKIKSILQNEQLRVTLEEGAKKYAAETSWLRVAARHVALYNKVLNV